MAGFESPDKFHSKKEGLIGTVYNLDEVNVRLLNGDGDGWVQGMAGRCSSDEVHLQLDPFHIKREIKRSGLSKEEQTHLNRLAGEKKPDDMLSYLSGLIAAITDDSAKKKAEKLFTYLRNNRNYLTPIKDRGLTLPDLPEGMEYGNMGAMETTVCNVVALRMKRRKASFTKSGATNLARLICCKRSGTLDDTIAGLGEAGLPMIIEEVITTVLSAAKAPKKDGKGYFYPVGGGFPFADTFTTNGRKAVKGLVKYKRLTELAFR
jgi:hypothetical protein